MTLTLLLDENISYVVAEQIRAKRPEIAVESIHTWREGAFLSTEDSDLLAALHTEGRMLVTYDTQIPAEQPFLFDGNEAFSGILFVDEQTIASSDFGGLVRALIAFCDANGDKDWRNQFAFLRQARRE